MNGELNIPWMIPKGGFYQMKMFLGFESYTDFFSSKGWIITTFYSNYSTLALPFLSVVSANSLYKDLQDNGIMNRTYEHIWAVLSQN